MAERYGGMTNIPSQWRVQTGAAAESNSFVAHAARARWLAEWVHGVPTTSVNSDGFTVSNKYTCEPCSHTTAPGHDHSGGYAGTPVVRPFWTCSLGYDAAQLAATGWGGSGITAPSAFLKSTSVSGERAYVLNNGAAKHVWIPGCGKDGAHYRGQVVLTVCASKSDSTPVTLYVEINGVRSTQSLSTSPIASGGTHTDWVIYNQVSLRPGTMNRIPLVAWIQGTASADTLVSVEAISINQVRTTP